MPIPRRCASQELSLQQELGDVRGECLAQGRLGAVHLSLGQLGLALRCYQGQLERARQLRDCPLETQALGNLGLVRLGLAHYEDAIGYFEQQLALLEQVYTATAGAAAAAAVPAWLLLQKQSCSDSHWYSAGFAHGGVGKHMS